MQITEHLEALRSEGDRLATVAEATAPDAPVGSCPGWQLRDLIRHVGSVHRWATGMVAEQRMDYGDLAEPEMLRAGPADDQLLPGWLREGVRRLSATLQEADPGVTCAAFLAAPSPLAFWARRQAHETAIHRADAELAAGIVPGELTPFPPGLARDGIDELIMGFARRASKRGLRADPPRWLAVHVQDQPGDTGDGHDGAGGHWLVRMGAREAEVTRGPVPDGAPPEGHGYELTGPPGLLYLALWNRTGPEGLVRQGDPGAMDAWRGQLTVRWT